ncbi:Capsular synthesis regulator component B [Serratia quinivorans]|uniref:response regulator transcription factor n=1 Tax=Serratia quinivorans TaxID=137545 RepID=UPI0021790918|nr:response regulator transcription factor [Serratia quinivorans]CAI1906092.1 Capsular synthesis regulator component B [Serratia quinivorans]
MEKIKKSLNIAIVEDEPLSRIAIHAILENFPYDPYDNQNLPVQLIHCNFALNVVGSVCHAQALMELLRTKNIDILLLDYSLESPENKLLRGVPQDGMALINYITKQHPTVKIIVHTAHSNRTMARLIYQAGVYALVEKNSTIMELFFAISNVINDKKYFPAELMGTKLTDSQSETSRLSGREMEILRMLHSGICQKQIADRLHISFKTVSNTKMRAFKKLGIKSNADFFKNANEIHL